MNVFENIRLALEGLRANKMRALLTMLGIIIGIASVMAISTLGSAMTGSITTTMDKIGTKNIVVSLTPKNYDSQSALQPEDYITQHELDLFKETYPDAIRAISLSNGLGSGELSQDFVHRNVLVTGINPDYGMVTNFKIIQGRSINQSDLDNQRNVIVLDKTLKNSLVGTDGNVIGMDVSVKTKNTSETYTVIGIYEKPVIDNPLFTMGDDNRVEVFLPITTVAALNSGSKPDNSYDTFTIMTTSTTDSAAFAQITKDYFADGLGPLSDYTVDAQSLEAIAGEASAMLGTLSLGISVIAGISLLVGGIGVMNIMLVSVTERTREIGIRKALGARNRAIRSQFIVEAMIICLIGGLIGVSLGSVLGVVGSNLLKFPTTPPFLPMIIALCFSMGIGVFFGYYPANKAAKLDPIDALRYE